MNQETSPIQHLLKHKISGEFSSANRANIKRIEPLLTRRETRSASKAVESNESDVIDYRRQNFEAGDLLAFHGLEFIDISYRAVLKRAPDPAGIRHYSTMLELGVNPRSVIEALRYSDEGEQVGVQINGIRSRIKFTCLSMPLMRLRMRRANR